MYIYKDARTSVILHGLSISGLGPEISRNGSGNFQYPGPQRVDPEMVFIYIFSRLESSRCNFRFAVGHCGTVQPSDRMETESCPLFFPG